MRFTVRRTIGVIVLFLVFFTVSAQQRVAKNITTNEGLASMQVYHMHQDPDGYMWFATDRGISCYNGYSFQNYGLEDGITCNTVFKFYPQPDGTIWCSTFNNRLFYFHYQTRQFIAYRYNDLLSAKAHNRVIDDFVLTPDSSVTVSYLRMGTISISKNGELQVFDFHESDTHINSTLITERLPNGSTFKRGVIGATAVAPFFSNATILSSFFLSDAREPPRVYQWGDYALLGFTNKLFVRQGDQLIKSFTFSKQIIGLGDFGEHSFYVSFLGGGIQVIDKELQLRDQLLEGQSTTFCFRDHENGLWISTLSSGVFYVHNYHAQQYEINQDNHVFDMAADTLGNLWISYYDKSVYVRSKKHFYGPRMTNSLNILLPHHHDLRKLNQCSVVHLCTGNLKFSMPYICMVIDELGLQSPLPRWSEPKLKLDFRIMSRINEIALAPRGIYLATNEGLMRFDSTTSELSTYTHAALTIRNEDIQRMGDRLIIATLGAGIAVMQNDEVVQVISRKDGLYSNIINRLYVQNDSTLWACTNQGLNRLIFTKDGSLRIVGISQAQGLSQNDVTDIEILRDTLWVGTYQGLFSFPMKELTFRPEVTKTFLQLLTLDVNDEVMTEKAVNFSYTQTKFTFTFQAISYRHHSGLLYRYRMAGLDSQWYRTEERMVTYLHMPVGDFTFQVQASFDGGKTWTNTTAERSFHIKPAFYSRWWFRLGSAVFVMLLIYVFFRIRVLTYNRDVVRELVRLVIKKMRKNEKYVIFREQGKEIKINTSEIRYVESEGNYVKIHTVNDEFMIRHKIGEFLSLVPDPLEYLRIHRSFIVRIDQVTAKSRNTITVGDVELRVSDSYLDSIKNIQL